MITGSCLCQAVKYELSEPPDEMTNCHCSMCRKAHGAAFATYARVRQNTLRFTAGEASLVSYRSSPRATRRFCARCGSPVHFLYDDRPGVAWITAGTLNQDPGIAPSEHIFVASRAPWHEITDDIAQHAGFPDGDSDFIARAHTRPGTRKGQ